MKSRCFQPDSRLRQTSARLTVALEWRAWRQPSRVVHHKSEHPPTQSQAPCYFGITHSEYQLQQFQRGPRSSVVPLSRQPSISINQQPWYCPSASFLDSATNPSSKVPPSRPLCRPRNLYNKSHNAPAHYQQPITYRAHRALGPGSPGHASYLSGFYHDAQPRPAQHTRPHRIDTPTRDAPRTLAIDAASTQDGRTASHLRYRGAGQTRHGAEDRKGR